MNRVLGARIAVSRLTHWVRGLGLLLPLSLVPNK